MASKSSVLQCRKLSKSILEFDAVNRLGGYFMQTTSYYCHVIMWHGRDLYYDGMGATK